MAEVALPDGFCFGVATAGFQVEGGFNGPGEPANNWGSWERAGRVEPSGIALDFWGRYEEQLDRAVAAGCDSFRLSVEWARCEPVEGSLDEDALARYLAILEACRDRALEPVVTISHFTHPAWLGEDFWLRPESPERMAWWAEAVVTRLGDRCSKWVTVAEPNVLAIESFVGGAFPPGRLGDAAAAVQALDHMLAAHVRCYGVVHDHQPDGVAAINPYCLSVYEVDQLLTDVLMARSVGIDRDQLRPWLSERRTRWHERLVRPGQGLERLKEVALRQLAARLVPLDQALPVTTAAVYESPYPGTLDVAQLDYYDPVSAHHLRVPGHRTAGGRHWFPDQPLWDYRPDPAGLTRFVTDNHHDGLGVWVIENGLCNRVRRGRSIPRLDGWDRARYLREHLSAVVAAIEAGVPVGGYWHWTLADNYEWGSYEPRFGLYGVDRERGLRWSDLDSMGVDAAGAYRRLANGLRQGDRSVLVS
jgi:beta-glucosidase/6-phospho-beta-glucosidase/beta-galactosidase